MALVTLLCFVILVKAYPVFSVDENLSEKLTQAEIVPDVLDTAVDTVLCVKFGNKEVSPGDELTPEQVQNQPTVDFSANDNDFFTIAMVDPDAPSRTNTTYREILHWLVGNVPGKDISAGDTLAKYGGSKPPKGTDLHRYILLLYKQKYRIDFEETFPDKFEGNRFKFRIRDFSAKYELQGPEAVNYFIAQWDESVDQ